MYFSSERDRLLRRLYPLKRLTQRFRANAIGYVEPLDIAPMPEPLPASAIDVPLVYEQQPLARLDAVPHYETPAMMDAPLTSPMDVHLGLPALVNNLLPAPPVPPGLELDSVPNPALGEIADAIEQARLGAPGPSPEPGGLEQAIGNELMPPGMPDPLFMT